MRLHEIEQLDELANENHRKQVNLLFKQNGFRKIGSGLDAMVFAKDTNTVTKIIFPEERYLSAEQMDKAAKALLLFTQYCEKNPSPHLPTVEHVGVITVDGEQFHQVIMERLQKIKVNSVTELMLWFMSDEVTKGTPWLKVYQEMCDPMSWELADTDVYAIANKIQKMPHNKLLGIANAYKVMSDLYKVGKQHGIGWDCHTENVMQRADGTLVITDPWSA